MQKICQQDYSHLIKIITKFGPSCIVRLPPLMLLGINTIDCFNSNTPRINISEQFYRPQQTSDPDYGRYLDWWRIRKYPGGGKLRGQRECFGVRRHVSCVLKNRGRSWFGVMSSSHSETVVAHRWTLTNKMYRRANDCGPIDVVDLCRVQIAFQAFVEETKSNAQRYSMADKCCWRRLRTGRTWRQRFEFRPQAMHQFPFPSDPYGATASPPQAVLVNCDKGEFLLTGEILPNLFLQSINSCTNWSIFWGVTLGMTTTCAMSFSQASCQRLMISSSRGRSKTTVELRSLTRQVSPASVSLSRR